MHCGCLGCSFGMGYRVHFKKLPGLSLAALVRGKKKNTLKNQVLMVLFYNFASLGTQYFLMLRQILLGLHGGLEGLRRISLSLVNHQPPVTWTVRAKLFL